MSLNVGLLEQSFERIKPCADEFTASFYENLFTAHPEVRPLFASTDMEKQQKKLLNALVLVVENLRNPAVLTEVLNALGARHVSYGAIPKYYPAVGQALLQSFAQSFQDDWTSELHNAWADAYQAITAQMLQGISGAHLEVAPDEEAIATEMPMSSNAVFSTEATAESLEIELLERSFEKIKPYANAFAARFYTNLFEAYPELKPLFANVQMAKQQQKLLNALVLIVENLRNPSALQEVLQRLGERHVGYGTIPRQYPAVGEALLKALEQQLQTDWTPALEQAWTSAFKVIAAQMLQGAAQSGPREQSGSGRSPILTSAAATTPIAPPSRQRSIKKSARQQSTPRWSVNLQSIVKSITDLFWQTPAWIIAAFVAVLMASIFWTTDANSQFAKILGGLEAISVVVALVLFVKEAPDRKKQFHYQAWSAIDAAHGVSVSYARVLALQDLNEDRVSLIGINAPNAELTKIQLVRANLSHANLGAANLSNANLHQANLNKANLSKANLSGANFSQANLSFAQLSWTNFSSANLNSANLICADLCNANLSGADLRNAKLSGASLTNAYLTGANLKGAQVSASELDGAFLEGAIMPDRSQDPLQN